MAVSCWVGMIGLGQNTAEEEVVWPRTMYPWTMYPFLTFIIIVDPQKDPKVENRTLNKGEHTHVHSTHYSQKGSNMWDAGAASEA